MGGTRKGNGRPKDLPKMGARGEVRVSVFKVECLKLKSGCLGLVRLELTAGKMAYLVRVNVVHLVCVNVVYFACVN